MFDTTHKATMFVIAFPLMLTFLVRDCAHQSRDTNSQPDRNINAQPAETSSKMENARIGTWGGEHISLEITAEGGAVEYDCAHGTIDQKIVANSEGRFTLRGTHVREHGGPVRKGETADSHPAHFVGQIKGDTMTLTVTESDTKEAVGTFTLVYGQQPRLMKCR
jgi:hypothetical protein